jgi:tight adherence protein B
MIPLLIGGCGALGVFYLFTSVIGWKGIGFTPQRESPAEVRKRGTNLADWLRQAGISDVTPAQFLAVEFGAAAFAFFISFGLLGGVLPAIAIGGFAATAPLAAYRSRRRKLRDQSLEAWPRLIEEVRVHTSSLGQSIPVALNEVGRNAPTQPMRDAFANASREWTLTTDFGRMIRVLKDGLADPTADATCETLLVAHELGGTDLDRRLRALIDDRTMDVEERRDAQSRQSGVRFARWFTLCVPIGMALSGMTIGNGRDSFKTPSGQLGVLLAVLLSAGCWVWAGRIMTLPEVERTLAK